MKMGFMLLDKPENWTTFDLIRDLRKKSKQRKFGHMGTLDPFATGLVIVALDSATRLSSLLIGKDKEYLVELDLGIKTDTGDRTGKEIESREIPIITEELLKNAASEMLEISEQTPPSYSAVKISGKRAYKLARAGETFELAPREIKVHSFEVLALKDKIISYKTTVSKGTYIRVLSETFAGKLGTTGHTKSLRRLSIGKIKVEDADSPEMINSENWGDFVIPVQDILKEFPRVTLDPKQIDLILHGNSIKLAADTVEGEVLLLEYDDTGNSIKQDCLGLGVIKESTLYPKKVFI